MWFKSGYPLHFTRDEDTAPETRTTRFKSTPETTDHFDIFKSLLLHTIQEAAILTRFKRRLFYWEIQVLSQLGAT